MLTSHLSRYMEKGGGIVRLIWSACLNKRVICVACLEKQKRKERLGKITQHTFKSYYCIYRWSCKRSTARSSLFTVFTKYFSFCVEKRFRSRMVIIIAELFHGKWKLQPWQISFVEPVLANISRWIVWAKQTFEVEVSALKVEKKVRAAIWAAGVLLLPHLNN